MFCEIKEKKKGRRKIGEGRYIIKEGCRERKQEKIFLCVYYSLSQLIPSSPRSLGRSGCGVADGEWELVTRLVGSRCE
jgi:hypothetical protein